MAGARLPGAVPSTAHLDCPAPELGQWQRGARCRARATGQQSARDRRVAKNEVTWVLGPSARADGKSTILEERRQLRVSCQHCSCL